MSVGSVGRARLGSISLMRICSEALAWAPTAKLDSLVKADETGASTKHRLAFRRLQTDGLQIGK